MFEQKISEMATMQLPSPPEMQRVAITMPVYGSNSPKEYFRPPEQCPRSMKLIYYRPQPDFEKTNAQGYVNSSYEYHRYLWNLHPMTDQCRGYREPNIPTSDIYPFSTPPEKYIQSGQQNGFNQYNGIMTKEQSKLKKEILNTFFINFFNITHPNPVARLSQALWPNEIWAPKHKDYDGLFQSAFQKHLEKIYGLSNIAHEFQMHISDYIPYDSDPNSEDVYFTVPMQAVQEPPQYPQHFSCNVPHHAYEHQKIFMIRANSCIQSPPPMHVYRPTVVQTYAIPVTTMYIPTYVPPPIIHPPNNPPQIESKKYGNPTSIVHPQPHTVQHRIPVPYVQSQFARPQHAIPKSCVCSPYIIPGNAVERKYVMPQKYTQIPYIQSNQGFSPKMEYPPPPQAVQFAPPQQPMQPIQRNYQN